MDISRHINLIKNHGYKGSIAMVKLDVKGWVTHLRPGQIVLVRYYKVTEDMDEETAEWNRSHCTIESPYSEEVIQSNLKENNGINTFGTCVGVPVNILEEIKI